MVVTNYPSWSRLLKQIGKLLTLIFFLSVASVLIDLQNHLLRVVTIPELVVSVLGAALGLLLGARTNAAYARWWEARTLWGAMINNSRSLARQAITFSQQEPAGSFAKMIIYQQIAFVHATRCSLRRQAPWDEIAPFLGAESLEALRKVQNVPDALLKQMGHQVSSAANLRIINDWQMQRMDTTLSDLSNVLGGCERIKNTPLPRQYDFYPEFFIQVYCLVLPFIIVDEVGLITPVVTVIVAFAFLVLNRIGKNLEDPFENRPYDCPMTSMCRTIEINLRQALGEKEVPEPLALVDGVLW